jgi:hypothetical protein
VSARRSCPQLRGPCAPQRACAHARANAVGSTGVRARGSRSSSRNANGSTGAGGGNSSTTAARSCRALMADRRSGVGLRRALRGVRGGRRAEPRGAHGFPRGATHRASCSPARRTARTRTRSRGGHGPRRGGPGAVTVRSSCSELLAAVVGPRPGIARVESLVLGARAPGAHGPDRLAASDARCRLGHRLGRYTEASRRPLSDR